LDEAAQWHLKFHVKDQCHGEMDSVAYKVRNQGDSRIYEGQVYVTDRFGFRTPNDFTVVLGRVIESDDEWVKQSSSGWKLVSCKIKYIWPDFHVESYLLRYARDNRTMTVQKITCHKSVANDMFMYRGKVQFEDRFRNVGLANFVIYLYETPNGWVVNSCSIN
jgi:hypothetical protein